MQGRLAPTQLTFVASTTSAAETISVSGSAQAGDWAILSDMSSNNVAISKVVPTGWTEISSDNLILATWSVVSAKILTAADVGATVTGMNTDAGNLTKVMFVFRPNGIISNAISSTWESEISLGNPSSQSVAASGVATPLVVLGIVGSTGSDTANFSTASPAFTATVLVDGGTGSQRMGYTIYNSSPSSHTIDANDLTGATLLASGYVRFV